MTAPNLFDYATTELSQDAFVCWMLAWADERAIVADPTMHQTGLDLLNALLQLHGQPQFEHVRVQVHKQVYRADIVVEVGKHLILLIEDKIHAGADNDLKQYHEIICRHFPHRTVLPIFFKTGDQSDYREIKQAGFKLFLREQLLPVLRRWCDRVSNAIFMDFMENLERRHTKIGFYAVNPVAVWTEEWDPWIGFYTQLQKEIRGFGWDYVPNRNGGFMGAYWHSKTWMDPGTGLTHEVYLQIEQGPLCFKIDVGDNEPRGPRDRWHERLIGTAKECGLAEVRRPLRMGYGQWMTVARIEQEHWLMERPDGTLDLDRTLVKLQIAADLIDRAVAAGI
ncbi:MAG TPA: hypothetical protein VE993_11785 [Stellaceae bacterium]|nr:hypothetical protein [Stellaceae bacterium]